MLHESITNPPFGGQKVKGGGMVWEVWFCWREDKAASPLDESPPPPPPPKAKAKGKGGRVNEEPQSAKKSGVKRPRSASTMTGEIGVKTRAGSRIGRDKTVKTELDYQTVKQEDHRNAGGLNDLDRMMGEDEDADLPELDEVFHN